MSLTQAEAVFASIHETALNDIVTAFCVHRPRLLFYGSPAFVPATTVAETQMNAIAFPGVPGGIQWRVRLTVPRIDLFKQTSELPPELALGPNQFSIALGAEICIECRKIRIDPKPPRPNDDDRESRDPQANQSKVNTPCSGPGFCESVRLTGNRSPSYRLVAGFDGAPSARKQQGDDQGCDTEAGQQSSLCGCLPSRLAPRATEPSTR